MKSLYLIALSSLLLLTQKSLGYEPPPKYSSTLLKPHSNFQYRTTHYNLLSPSDAHYNDFIRKYSPIYLYNFTSLNPYLDNVPLITQKIQTQQLHAQPLGLYLGLTNKERSVIQIYDPATKKTITEYPLAKMEMNIPLSFQTLGKYFRLYLEIKVATLALRASNFNDLSIPPAGPIWLFIF